MTEINKSDINIARPLNKAVNAKSDAVHNEKTQDITKDYKEAADNRGAEALGRAMVNFNGAKKVDKADNIELDVQKIINNPRLLDRSEVLFRAAERAGVAYPEAASFSTSELG